MDLRSDLVLVVLYIEVLRQRHSLSVPHDTVTHFYGYSECGIVPLTEYWFSLVQECLLCFSTAPPKRKQTRLDQAGLTSANPGSNLESVLFRMHLSSLKSLPPSSSFLRNVSPAHLPFTRAAESQLSTFL